jgi:5-methyltetrahydropteroyltriglutamate--homocysteine methyltransferase
MISSVRPSQTYASALDAGAHNVQLDFTEGRLAVKLDPSLGLLRTFIALNNEVLGRFSDADRQRLGVHTCPGGDRDLHAQRGRGLRAAAAGPLSDAGRELLRPARQRARSSACAGLDQALVKPSQRVFVGVTDPIDPRVETPYTVRDRVLEAARVIPVDRLGTTDDCGFSPFADDTSTARQTAFDKIRRGSRAPRSRAATSASELPLVTWHFSLQTWHSRSRDERKAGAWQPDEDSREPDEGACQPEDD